MGEFSTFWTPARATLVLIKVLDAEVNDVVRATSSARLPASSGVRNDGFDAFVDIDLKTSLIVLSPMTAAGLA